MTLLDKIFPETSAVEWAPELGNHLSATRIGMLERCPEQFRRRYVLGEKERPGAALIWGGADHVAHEVNFRQKIDSHEDIPVGDVQIAFAEAFDARVEAEGGIGEIEWGNEGPGDVKDAGVELVTLYHRLVSPGVQPTAVEREFSLTVPDVAVPIVGRMDIETKLPAIERKTAKRAAKEIKPTWRIQGLIYQLVEQRPIEWHLSVKTKTPAVYTSRDTPGLSLAVTGSVMGATELMIQTAARRLLAYWQVFGPDEPWPGALSHDWACSFCGYKSTCAWWGNAQVQLSKTREGRT